MRPTAVTNGTRTSTSSHPRAAAQRSPVRTREGRPPGGWLGAGACGTAVSSPPDWIVPRPRRRICTGSPWYVRCRAHSPAVEPACGG